METEEMKEMRRQEIDYLMSEFRRKREEVAFICDRCHEKGPWQAGLHWGISSDEIGEKRMLLCSDCSKELSRVLWRFENKA